MPLNIGHAEDAFLSGSADWDEFIEKFEAEWYKPLGLTLVGALMRSIPPEVKAQLNPQAVSALEQQLGGNYANRLSS